MTSLLRVLVASTVLLGAAADGAPAEAKTGQKPVAFQVVDAAGQLLPCRIHVKDSKGEPQRAGSLPSFADHFSCEGSAALSLGPGKYTYLIERGPEYRRIEGSFEVGEEALQIREKLERLVDLASEGWWSGELHVHRPPQDMPLLLRAEDLHVAPTITWWNKTSPWKSSSLPGTALVRLDENRAYHVLGGEDERQGGAFLFYNLERPVDITGAEQEYPCPIRFLEEAARQKGAWIDIEKPFWWDVPVALAHGFGQSIGIAHNHMWHGGVLDNEAWGKPRDREVYPGPHGNALWSQQIYYHVLQSGIRIPPSAGSASGVLPNPVGYNRVYVHLDGPFSWEKWWASLREGRSFVTNGPLLRARVDGKLPGHVFAAKEGEALELEVTGSLDGNDPVLFVEIIKDGVVERTVPREEISKAGSIGRVRFERSGWLLVRAVAATKHTFRFASTAPFWVEVGSEKRLLSRKSIQFFLDWVKERMGRIDLKDPGKLREVLRYHEEAKKFWEARLEGANAP